MQHIGIQKRDESGNIVEQFNINFLPIWNAGQLVDNAVWIHSIDPYGLTIFNSIQLNNLIKELKDISGEYGDPEFDSIIKIFEQVKNEDLMYIAFIGD